ncbi:MAG: hypothetical protein G3M78_05335 [Candidatus Nitrohelix vancouverensis]|uniref:Ribosomal protein L7/L12 C-terminal domain-containing protein n=1 Tax=Candidatus Nitrohelix vancouverensis TaxID=2705534 RepID=A0A7T0C1J6_9BACT|nr:MAG: hypothetical protein G3M78_05335 [Candidatus Nitrohelix vancouverensis]
MKFHSITDCPAPEARSLVCRVSSLVSCIGMLVTGLLSGGLLYLDLFWKDHDLDLPLYVLRYIEVVIACIFLLFLFHFRKSLRTSNWLLRLDPGRAVIKFRSYLNDHLPEEDKIVVEIPCAEIAWARKTKERVVTNDRDGAVYQFFTFLDLKLKSQDAEALRQAILDERNRRPPIEAMNRALFQARKRRAPDSEIALLKAEIKQEEQRRPKGGSRFSTTLHHHYPVRMTDASILRLDWSGVRPRIGKALEALEASVALEPVIKISSDFTQPAQNIEEQILDLAARGETFKAIALTRERYGYSVAEAKAFVESLLGKDS